MEVTGELSGARGGVGTQRLDLAAIFFLVTGQESSARMRVVCSAGWSLKAARNGLNVMEGRWIGR